MAHHTLHAEPMTWRVMHDRDAFKKVWLLFENADGRFPLYPGETAWIEYVYTVSADKWGPWWQRAVRLPTRRMSLSLDFPAELGPGRLGHGDVHDGRGVTVPNPDIPGTARRPSVVHVVHRGPAATHPIPDRMEIPGRHVRAEC